MNFIITTFVELIACDSLYFLRPLVMIEIVEFQPEHASAFKTIGEEWMNEFISIDASDQSLLDHPVQNILGQGGFIFMAIDNDTAVGTCALIQKSKDRWELSKLGVTKSHRGLGIGRKLSLYIIEKAKALGLSSLYLESSHKLHSALKLYERLGFKPDNSCYESGSQCDIKLVLDLTASNDLTQG